MANKAGHLVMNGIDDEEIIMLLQQKAKGKLGFNPQTLTSVNVQTPQGPMQVYNNCTLSFNGDDSLKVVYTALHKLIHGHEHEPNF